MGGGALSLLSALEPILGVSITLNLAFLNIHKFQYITIVREKLDRKLGALDQKVKDSVDETAWYIQLKSLASVDTLDLEWPNFTKQCWIKSPGLWGFTYNVLFYWRFARVGAIIATAYSISLLFLGAGHQAGATTFLQEYFNDSIECHFAWSMTSAFFPILSVIAGEFVCISAVRFVNYQTDNIKTNTIGDAEKSVADLVRILSDPVNSDSSLK